MLAGQDAGGLRREYFNNMSLEILEKLKLFIPSPNHRGNVGLEREKMVPNPQALSTVDMKNFFKVGFCMAVIINACEVINLNMPSIFYKFLLGKFLHKLKGTS